MTATAVAANALVTRKNDFVLSGPIGSFDAYMDKVSRIPVLSREDEAALANRFRNDGDLAPALRGAHRSRLLGLRAAARRRGPGRQRRPHEGREAFRPHRRRAPRVVR